MKRKRKKWDGVQIVSTVLILLLFLAIVIPFWNAIIVSLESPQGYIKNPFAMLPVEFTFDNYKYLFQKGDILFLAYKGTILVTVIGTVTGMVVSVMAAYVFSRKFPGKRFFFIIMLITMYFSGGLIPTYLMIKNMGLMNTYTVIILINLVSAYNVIIMKNGFESVPMALQEAAMIDGANDMRIFVRIMLPLQKPLIATFSLFTMVGYWNSWYWPMLLLNGGDKTVLQLFLRTFVNNLDAEMQYEQDVEIIAGLQFSQGVRMASVFIVMLPIMLVYPFLQKYFTKGIIVGAVKM